MNSYNSEILDLEKKGFTNFVSFFDKNEIQELKTEIEKIIDDETDSYTKRDYDPLILIGKGTPKFVGSDFLMLPEVESALKKMTKAAKKEGIKIKVVSAYRSYDRQKVIWNSKFVKFKKEGFKSSAIIDQIIKYSTIPGTSRHHWGTDIDIIDESQPAEGDLLVTKKFHGSGPYNKLRVDGIECERIWFHKALQSRS